MGSQGRRGSGGGGQWRVAPTALLVLLLVLVPLRAGGPAGAQAGRVLALLYFPGRSHFVVFEALLKQLAARGHQVDVVSHFPQKEPLPNYRDFSLEGSSPSMVDAWSFEILANYDFFDILNFMWHGTREICEKAMEHPSLQRFASRQPYDVVIVEIFGTECAYGYAHRVGAPVIAMTTLATLPWAHGRVGNSDNPAFVPLVQTPYTTQMTFWQRTLNALGKLYITIGDKVWNSWPTDRALRKHLGADLPPLDELINRNTSLVLVNSHFSLHGASPTVPGYVEVGGLHIDPNPGKLPQELQAFVDGAGPHGVVLVSFGSLNRAETMEPAKLQALLRVLGSLPQRVVWRINGAKVPGGLPANVLGLTWIPQSALLSQKQMRAFVSHGGLGGTLEAVHWGVPVLVVPFFSDQRQNGHLLQEKGAGRMLRYADITEHTFRRELGVLLQDKSYRENAQRLSREFRDRPQTPMETAVWWTEYVMRHKGAPQLRSAAVDLYWYQLLLLDVVAFLAAAAATLMFVICYIARCIWPKKKSIEANSKKKLKHS